MLRGEGVRRVKMRGRERRRVLIEHRRFIEASRSGRARVSTTGIHYGYPEGMEKRRGKGRGKEGEGEGWGDGKGRQGSTSCLK